MPHFFVPPGNIASGRFFLNPDESRHLAVVLRKKPGDQIRLFDGADRCYRALLGKVEPDRVEGTLLDEGTRGPFLPYRLRLFQGLPKGEKMEWILEKATELGAAEIVPVVTERSVGRVPPDRLSRRLERWRKIVLSAAKQCGRTDAPEVRAPVSFDEALALCGKDSLILFPWEGEEAKSLKGALKALRSGSPSPHPSPMNGGGRTSQELIQINLFIGPEGGFSPAEVEKARAAGAVTVTLGPLILRTETAGLMAASALLYEFGFQESMQVSKA